jgi:DNA-binding response OmpR family regulator
MAGNETIRKLLIVDDEKLIADTMSAIFSARGYAVRVAYTPDRAIEIIADWEPHLAIVDVMLPLMNGIDFSIVLKAKYPACNILLFSGQPDTGKLLEEALNKGHRFEVLAKPLHPALILERVENLLSSAEPLTDTE